MWRSFSLRQAWPLASAWHSAARLGQSPSDELRRESQHYCCDPFVPTLASLDPGLALLSSLALCLWPLLHVAQPIVPQASLGKLRAFGSDIAGRA